MIQFSLFDKDIITADDFGGETYFPLSAVPGNNKSLFAIPHNKLGIMAKIFFEKL